MEIIIYVLMAAMLIFVFSKNITLLRRYRHNKNYIACYRTVLNGDENAYDCVNNFINNDKSEEYINKARILKLYHEIKNGLDYSDSLNGLDLRKIYFNAKNEKDATLVSLNSDSFVFLMMSMCKAYANNLNDVINAISEKVRALEELNGQLEYNQILALQDILLNNNDGIAFMNRLLDGTYVEYKYDKNLIGLYKRIAAAALSYKAQPIGDYEEDLKVFAKSLIGKQVLSDLKLYDKYAQNEVEGTQE